MRIAFDVSPLSHPATGVGNYIRGSLGGLLEAAAGALRIVLEPMDHVGEVAQLLARHFGQALVQLLRRHADGLA